MSGRRWSKWQDPEGGGAVDDRVEALERLAALLDALADRGEPMTVGEMDGFVTGLVVYPEVILPSEWLWAVWGADTDFGSIGDGEETVAALIGHYNWVARTLANEPAVYGPVLEVDEGTEEVFWKAWIVGFVRAMRWRPGAWARIEGSDELDVIEAVQVIHTLYAAANGTSKLTEEGLDLLDGMAPMLIGGMVRDLSVWQKSRGVSAEARLVADVPGAAGWTAEQNRQCGCGSGRAYDRCCGAH